MEIHRVYIMRMRIFLFRAAALDGLPFDLVHCLARTTMSSPELGRGEEELVVGHNGAGDDCITKVVTYGRNSALAGEISVVVVCFS